MVQYWTEVLAETTAGTLKQIIRPVCNKKKTAAASVKGNECWFS